MIPNKYDPRLKKTDELEATFINGEEILTELFNFLKPNKEKLTNQSWIIAGPRGIGKSHLLTLLARRIENDDELYQRWLPILFPEEVFMVDSLYRLFMYVIEKVFRINEKEDELPELFTKFCEIKNVRISGNRDEKREILHRLAKESFTILIELSKQKQKKFIFMIENMQYLFEEQLSSRDLKDLRGILNEYPDVFIIIGTALSVLDHFNHYEEPFYQYFRIRKMEAVDKNGIIDFLNKIADYWGHNLNTRIKENKSYIYTYQILTDGNPRLVLFLYELLLDNDILNIDRILDKISELTPYFLNKTKDKSVLKNHILDALALEAPTQTASEIADYIQYDDMRSLAAQLKRLVNEGWLKQIYFREQELVPIDKKKMKKKEINKKECFYTLRDYFYRIWYKVRMGYSESRDIHCLSELAVFLFNREEIEARYKKYSGIDEMKASFYEHSLMLMENVSFMKNITLLREDSERQVKRESLEYSEKIKEENPVDHIREDSENHDKRESLGYSAKIVEENPVDYIREDSENQVKRESLKYDKKIVTENPVDHKALYNLGNSYYDFKKYEKSIEYYKKAVKIKPTDHKAWFNMGLSFFYLEKYEKSIECYQQIIESQSDLVHDPYYYLKYRSVDSLIIISPQVFSSSQVMKNLLDKTTSLSCKITSLYRLLLLGKWIAITDTFELLLKEKALLQENTHILEFTLSAYIIHLLKEENGNRELLEVTKSWLSLIKIKHNDEESKKLFLQFLYFTVMLTAKEHVPMEKLEKVLDEVKNRILISDVLFILLRAIKNPTTREAQKWMADPLFKIIVEKLGAVKERNSG